MTPWNITDERYKVLALSAKLPGRPLSWALALLRLHQLTGEARWVVDAARLASRAPGARFPALDTALLVAEFSAPERFMAPPFLL